MGIFLTALAQALVKAFIQPVRKFMIRWVWRRDEQERALKAKDFAERNIQASKTGDTAEIEKDL